MIFTFCCVELPPTFRTCDRRLAGGFHLGACSSAAPTCPTCRMRCRVVRKLSASPNPLPRQCLTKHPEPCQCGTYVIRINLFIQQTWHAQTIQCLVVTTLGVRYCRAQTSGPYNSWCPVGLVKRLWPANADTILQL